MRSRFIFTALFLFFNVLSGSASAAQSFESWLESVRDEARIKGIRQEILDQSLSNIQPIDRVIALDRKQPEGTMTFDTYKKRVISQARIDQGRRLLREHSVMLNDVSKKYGVPPSVIVALWGIETSYGQNTGGFDVIEALATLAYDGRRAEFFRAELMNALKILNDGHISPSAMKGSWAGAMGQNQFMPSSFITFAVDGNGDGRRDIWNSLPDVFSSTANYLSRSGWNENERWGRLVLLPPGFEEDLAGLKITKPLQAWQNLGIRLPNGSDLPQQNMQASVVLPGGLQGPAYLVYDNYRVIMKWNKSTYFATSVGLLSDLIAKTP